MGQAALANWETQSWKARGLTSPWNYTSQTTDLPPFWGLGQATLAKRETKTTLKPLELHLVKQMIHFPPGLGQAALANGETKALKARGLTSPWN